MKQCEGYDGSRIAFDLQFFYYSFLNRCTSDWGGSAATIFPDSGSPTLPFDLRHSASIPKSIIFKDSGWHCSYCFQELAQFRNKLRSFAHEALDLPKIHEQDRIVNSIHNSVFFFRDRPDAERWRRVDPDHVDTPQHVLDNADRFSFLLDRSGPTAELSDFKAS